MQDYLSRQEARGNNSLAYDGKLQTAAARTVERFGQDVYFPEAIKFLREHLRDADSDDGGPTLEHSGDSGDEDVPELAGGSGLGPVCEGAASSGGAASGSPPPLFITSCQIF